MKYFYQSNLLRIILLTIGISISIFYKEIKANEINTLIKEFCLNEFKKEMKESGKELIPEVGEFTCNCFINKIETGKTLKLARENCKEEVSKIFNL